MSGDIDYIRLFDYLAERNITPHFVLEQAVEAKSSNKTCYPKCTASVDEKI